MFKKILIFLLSVFIFVLSSTAVGADNEFTVDANVTYKVHDNGRTEVTHDITLENNFSTLYATSYTLSLESIDAQDIRAYNEKGVTYGLDIAKDGDKTNIKITFSDAVVGKSARRRFFISYNNDAFSVKTGEVWEVSIPRLDDSATFRNYSVNLLIPESFGLEAYISPKPQSSNQNDQGRSYTFDKKDLVQTGITAGFGQFQVFSFNLSYHLENPLGVSSQTQIALPPDTAFQKVYLQKVDPKPNDMTVDSDGNWIATYKLFPRQRVDVMVNGSVQIFASFRKFPKSTNESFNNNLKEAEYWQVNDQRIKELASTLKTPKAIYDYVSKTLKYDFTRVIPNSQRYGAIKALQNPEEAICMEFTDLFIAIARAAGIPAREIDGYAYTENPQLQPLSLVADVLHAWPEYYDKEKEAWIPVDPTWGSTSGGVDYFNKLDLRHFAFVIHGKDSTKPYPPGSYKLGLNPQKDVYVSFGKLPENRITIPNLSVKSNYSVEVYNPGPEALYSLYPTVYFDKIEHSKDFIEIFPPFGTYKFQVKVPFSLLGKNTPDKIKIVADSSTIIVSTNKTQMIIVSLIALFALFLVIILGILYKFGKIRFNVKKWFTKSS